MNGIVNSLLGKRSALLKRFIGGQQTRTALSSVVTGVVSQLSEACDRRLLCQQ